MRRLWGGILALCLSGGIVQAQTDEPIIINLNSAVNKSDLGPFFSNNQTQSGAGVIVIGPNEEVLGEPQVDHVRIVQYGFGIDPIYGCNFANGDVEEMEPVRNRETLCTFQARGCTDPEGCTLEGDGFGLSTVQLRISACEDWAPGSRCTRVMLSTTQEGTSNEWTKVIWDDGGPY